LFHLAVPRQGSVPPTTGSQIFSSTSCANTAFFSADPDAKHICIASNCPKDSRKPLALTFPDTSLFIKVVRSLERKIDERLFDESHSSKSMTFNEIKLQASFAESVVLPTMAGFFVF